MGIQEKIIKTIEEALSKEGIEYQEGEVIVEMPNDSSKGEYSTNIAMKLSSRLKTNPMDIANRIVSSVQEDPDIQKVEAVKPGFINIFVSNTYLLKELSKMQQLGEEYFKLDEKVGKKIVVEYTDANPFKEFHIGHLYTNSVGESFARLQEAVGADVKRANYQGDVGLHVAKALWGLEQKLTQENMPFQKLEEMELSDRVRYLGEAYVYGATQYDEVEDKDAIDQINNINYYIFSLLASIEKKDFSEYEAIKLSEKYKKGRQWCLEYFDKIYEKLGTEFDYFFFESEVGEIGLNAVKENIGKVFEEDDGAVIYRGDEKKNLHTRVFINRYGLPTYEAKEIGLAIRKGELLDYDESIVITAEEQSGYFRVVLDALSKINPELAVGITHVPHGEVKLPGNRKMSSREGGIVSGEWLIKETQSMVKEVMQSNEKIEVDDLDAVSEKIAIGAIKYAFLKVGVGRDLIFDFEKSISFDGDTGPYLMYVYSRALSILEDAGEITHDGVCVDSCFENPYTRDLSVSVGKCRNALLVSATNYSPSILCQYLFDLGQKFNAFYQNVRVLDAPEDEREILLLLVNATMVTMKNGLKNLGISVVDRM